jgi:hypothetical protein
LIGTLAVTTMGRSEKQRIRDRIGQHLDVGNTRLSDDDALFLLHFVDNYAEKYRGRPVRPRRREHDGWSSDGKFTRVEEWIYTFTDDVGIRVDYSYSDDDGQRGSWSTDITDARGILDWFRENSRRLA